MARFVDDRKFVDNKLRENQEQSLFSFSEKLGSAPTFVTYFNRKLHSSTADKHLDNVHQVVGAKSPTRFNKIEGFPIYKIDTMSLDRSISDFGAESDITLNAEVLPGTITPYPDDIVFLEYNHAAENKSVLVLRVDNVTESVMDSRRYYKITLHVYDKPPGWVEDQVESSLRFEMSDYENNRTAILPYALSSTLKNCREMRAVLVEKYLSLFFDRDVNALVYCDPYGKCDEGMINFSVQLLAEKLGIFSFNRKIMKTAVNFCYSQREENFYAMEDEFESTVYSILVDSLSDGFITASFLPSPISEKSTYRGSIFHSYLKDYSDLTPWPPAIKDVRNDLFDISPLNNFEEHIKSNVPYRFAEEGEVIDPDDPLKPITDKEAKIWLENFLISFKELGRIKEGDYNEIISLASSTKIKNNKESFMRTPILIGFLKIIEEQIVPIISKPMTFERV